MISKIGLLLLPGIITAIITFTACVEEETIKVIQDSKANSSQINNGASDKTANTSTPVPSSATASGKQYDIEWLERVDIPVAYGKYPRIVKITKGIHAGELLLTYQDMQYGGNFWAIRSKDEGLTWSKPQMLLARDAKADTQLANCNIIELQDGRLMMVHQERERSRVYAPTSGIKVRYSTDGGETWTAEVVNGVNTATRQTGDLILRGDGWEPRQIQVPNDKNGDGHKDIYVFWTNHFHPETKGDKLEADDKVGQGVTYVVSYDNGRTWHNPSKERYTGGILFRSFDEGPELQREKGEWGSGGGMPTPFVLPNNRLAFVAEAVEQRKSPWLVASDPGDWDFESFLKQPWSSIEFTGLDNNDNAYPKEGTNAWLPTSEWGGAPYACVLPNGKIAVSQNSNKRIRVWVGDANGRNMVEQVLPFGTQQKSFYSFIEPINDTTVIVGAHEPDNLNKIMIRRGKIKR